MENLESTKEMAMKEIVRAEEMVLEIGDKVREMEALLQTCRLAARLIEDDSSFEPPRWVEMFEMLESKAGEVFPRLNEAEGALMEARRQAEGTGGAGGKKQRRKTCHVQAGRGRDCRRTAGGLQGYPRGKECEREPTVDRRGEDPGGRGSAENTEELKPFEWMHPVPVEIGGP